MSLLDHCPFLSQETHKKIEEYLEWSPSQKEREKVTELLGKVSCKENAKIVEDRFLKRLEFGTAGLRGKLGCGFNCMNDLIVIQTTQGIASYMLKKYGTVACKERGVVIGYDGRHGSKQFAHAAAAVFLSKSFTVYLNSSVVATPIIPFAILNYNCLGGIQITASHNPKDDNGYKVYAENGAQITSPVDEHISASILENLKPWDDALSLIDLKGTDLLKKDIFSLKTFGGTLIDPYKELFETYLTTISKELCLNKVHTANSPLKFVYTSMHGVGYLFVVALLKKFGLDVDNMLYSVHEQQTPDPEFSTVKFPNPEEKGALDMSIELANKKNVSIILANDPDADRFACAEKQSNGKWKVFTGDEIGILLAHYRFETLLESEKCKPEQLVFINSAVSSRLLQTFCKVEGCMYTDTMTGFKWIMNEALKICKINSDDSLPKIFALAYEEALGYALTLKVPDKDGVSAAAVWMEMSCNLYSKNITLTDKLQNLYTKYGLSITSNSYFICPQRHIVQQIFSKFRLQYPKEIGEYTIRSIRDVSGRYDSSVLENKECKLPFIPSSEMVTLTMTNGVTITFRTSGTEPKLKWYSEIISKDEPEKAKTILENTLKAAIHDVLLYEEYKNYLTAI